MTWHPKTCAGCGAELAPTTQRVVICRCGAMYGRSAWSPEEPADD